MTDPNSPEAIAQRANQEDPIVMYLIVREAIGMSVGKTAAQCGHAVGLLDRKHDLLIAEIEVHFDPVYGPDEGFWENLPQQTKDSVQIWDEWDKTFYCKIVLKADEKEWVRLKAECPNYVIVVDAGLTQLSPGTETVIGLWPVYKSQAPKIIKRLQLL